MPATNDEHGAHGHDDGAPHGSFKGYVTGFVLAAMLTIIPFALVMTGALGSTSATVLAVLGLAVIQIVVHMVYFLHMNARVEGGWSLLALVFTAIFVVITLSGSIWVMYNMNTNMMPPMTQEAMQQLAQ
ncbi:cytochrome o ubiquinol oxidase subunit IV [Parasphingorhabdus halotolerans]|uniref:Cytochrome bo(3) ubiquinol oxidase subunit 4 n=2 Tax=Parasphingorhabdus halotolerans TaxID=2725558 RepID=A0A6H2DR40_9SPHN|nr:cytochrome o ubiquinol oxidase subunit IV [Parasphingorhabdus halotolerans]